ncbi:hypothetical protein [Vibrio cholerae]|uniref:hypothetical protein n=1 Tax=Vibrio cholerae TaxID=666 RepID=UPI0027DEB58F|nr:hypothetical protein [Vibrio cholerae]MDQ4621924.1 hypothetical protein [Vibrio cholerae]MDQ4694984.1 hypothetical protein [Vibrio cholerae]
MDKLSLILKSRKVIRALVALLAALMLSLGYQISPEFQSLVSQAVCEVMECIE